MDSAATIVADGCRIAKARGMTAQGGRFLQSTLNDLALKRNLKVLLSSLPVTIPANINGPINFPLDYRRVYDWTYTLQGQPYWLDEISQQQYDYFEKDQSTAAYPAKFMTDLSGAIANPVTAPLAYVVPMSLNVIATTLRYFKKVAEMATPLENSAVVPWFEDQEYLRMDVARQLMQITDDERLDKWDGDEGLVMQRLRRHLLTEGDEQRLAKNIRLDPNQFRTAKHLRATKQTVW